MSGRLLCALVLVTGLLAPAAQAHDPSAWGGTYRSRDHGLSWLSADSGLFVGGALDLAISPTDPTQLLYATDSRLLRSRNGGRDWTPEAPSVFFGPTLAVAFLEDGKGAVASTAGGIFRTGDGHSWQAAVAPDGAAPARRIVVAGSGLVVVLGPRGVYVSNDGGRKFTRSGQDVLPDEPATAAVFGHDQNMFVVVGGGLWASADAGATWQLRGAGLPKNEVEAVAADPEHPRRLWAGAADRVFVSSDYGETWTAFGRPLPEAGTSIRAVAVNASGKLIVLATHRGAIRSQDAGESWNLVEGTLPVHLEAGPLVRDPHNSTTLYIGFSLMPYPEIWRRAEQGNNLLSQIDPVSLAGGAAFLILLLLVGALAVRTLLRMYGASPSTKATASVKSARGREG